MKTAASALVAGLVLFAASADAQTRVTLKAAKAGSSYYQMAVQLAEAMPSGIAVTVEESQGSVQNVMEATVRGGDYVFTSPPSLVGLARDGKAMFADRASPKFADIRALFPIPSLTMHFVVRADQNVSTFADLEGKSVLLGKGSFGAREGEKYMALFGLDGKVDIADAELSNAVAALKNGQIDAFVTAGSFPAPNVVEAAAGSDVTLISMTDDEVAATKRTRLVIPAGTYAGQDEEVVTTSLPVVAYATTGMDDDTAYTLTKAFWDKKAALGSDARWWDGVTPELLANITGQIHPGALKYYEEAGIEVPETAQ
ncbi:TAXI family TRAP transporter solute-binding subunit [Acuticoccus sp. MNP-M23]|uniref:TAXI family TRAP transporter solute-binding subunit n=1 Tax=Acuticoccus sp. MNP-M23 TaxID=3072793 RepID=UPI002815A49E|nr:TAXI family TRAP transporter solute-binding subunit [Acuticoccus sp. MNP-M23]WMS45018.1 TAXI family TRAP transporter solute-binding subunit [Acuticoccus sp. MNP-M23]